MTIADKLYVVYKSIKDNWRDLFLTDTPKNVTLQDVDDNGNLVDFVVQNLGTSKKKLDDWVVGAEESSTGMKNLMIDPFGLEYTVDALGRKIPTNGFLPEYGIMNIECVSPYEKGAASIDGDGSFTDFTTATEAKPTNNTYGKVFGRGGLSSTWGGNRSNGYIFKITSIPNGDDDVSSWLNLSNNDSKTFAQVGGGGSVKVRFRAWIYIEKGKLGFGNHSGYAGMIKGEIIDTLKEWQFVDVSFTNTTGNPFYRGLNIGTDSSEELEAYMAAPLITCETGGQVYIA